jgi:hypothetical protein
MMYLVLEDVGEHARHALRVPRAALADEDDRAVESRLVEPLAARDQAAIGLLLCGAKRLEARGRLGIGVERGPAAAASRASR